VTFHELAPRLTRIEVNVDVDPGSLIEKAARGMRHVKRAVRADLHRFKAYLEMQERETGAWRGVIEDGELVEDHDPGYDEEREYGEVESAASDEAPRATRFRRGRTTCPRSRPRRSRPRRKRPTRKRTRIRRPQRQRLRRFERQARASASGRRPSSGRGRRRGSTSGGGNGRSSGGRSGGQRKRTSRS
jgi:uncharacterized membrane protein YgcG